MNKFSKILEGSKILAITDKNGREYRFVGDREREKVSAKMTYYLWLSRFFIVTSAASLLLFLAASLSLFNLAPQVTVEPFLIIDQSSSDEIVRYEPIAHDMASKKMMMETFVRQYVMYRNTIINDEREMMVRWYAGGILNYLSAPQVFDEFAKYREGIWKDITDNQTSQEVEIISIGRVGGEKSPVWKVDFKTYEVSAAIRKPARCFSGFIIGPLRSLPISFPNAPLWAVVCLILSVLRLPDIRKAKSNSCKFVNHFVL